MEKQTIDDRIHDFDVNSLLLSIFEHNKTVMPDFYLFPEDEGNSCTHGGDRKFL